MRIVLIKSKLVCSHNEIFEIYLGYGHYKLGFCISTGKVYHLSFRIMLIKWHLIIHLSKKHVNCENK